MNGRTLMRWHGSKARLAPWLVKLLPPHSRYVEPFGGAFAVGLAKPRSAIEVYNDLDADLVNVMRLLAGPRAVELIAAVRATPYAREELARSFARDPDPLEDARRMLVRSFMGYSPIIRRDLPTGFRSSTGGNGRDLAAEWGRYADTLQGAAARLVGVEITQLPALGLISSMDDPETLIFADPPYLPATRSQKRRRDGSRYHSYAHDLGEEDHVDLVRVLKRCASAVVLCGYASDLYDSELDGWTRLERPTRGDRALPRTEVVWIKPARGAV